MAAAYAFHIAENQPFVDGNKRAAIGAALVFLDINGVNVPEGRPALPASASFALAFDSNMSRSQAGK
jgi:death-on-curing protein